MVEPVEVEPVDGDPLATIGQRIIARLIDWILSLAIVTPIGLLAVEGDVDQPAPVWSGLVALAIIFVYEAGCVAFRGQTPGKAIVGIEIVSVQSAETPSPAAAVARVLPVVALLAVLGFYAYVPLVFVYFTAGFMKHRRGLLDRLAGTAVVRARRGGGLLGRTGLGA